MGFKGKSKKSSQAVSTECWRCGGSGHFSKDANCPAHNKECEKCGYLGHFAKVCKTDTAKYKKNRGSEKKSKFSKKKVYQMEQDQERSSDEDFAFSICEIGSRNSRDNGKMSFKVGGIDLQLTVDSGASVNVVSQKTWNDLKMKKIKCKSTKLNDRQLHAYGKVDALQVIGKFETELEIQNRTENVEFLVIEEDGCPILGKESAERIGVLKIGLNVNQITMKEVEDRKCFQNTLGKIKDFQLDIKIDPEVQPVAQPYRRIPIPLQKKVENKLDEMLKESIIEKVVGPTTWASPVVVIPKSEKEIRLCIDMRRANEAVSRERHPLPTFDDILPEIKDSKWFTKLDLRNAYHQIELSPESRKITTFVTHKGLYQYTRLLFGLNCAPEIFQRVLEQILQECQGVCNFIDDILIHASNEKEHDERVRKVLDTLEQKEITLNKDKCQFGVSEVIFMGHRLTDRGVKPTEDKVKCIESFRRPGSTEETRSFLGLVNFVGRYIPNLVSINEPLRRVAKKSVQFFWNKEQEEAFQTLKASLSKVEALGYYDPADHTQVIADASPVGLGAVLVQIKKEGPRVISYASKSLSEVEKRYSQTEREALALVWACERFSIFLIGKKFDLITDHRPLEAIFCPKSKPCARIERWVLRMQCFKYNVIYKPGKTNIADPLSRLCQQFSSNTYKKQTENYVKLIAQVTIPKAMTLEQIQEESKKDEEIQQVKKNLMTGIWKEDELKHYKVIKEELSEIEDVLFRGTRMVIPKSLRQQALEVAHEGHPGIVAMKQRLRSKVWWPKIDQNAEWKVKTCPGCQLVALPDAPEPMKRRKLPTGPWKELAVDFMGPLPSGHYLFVVVDYFSRYFEVEAMKIITSEETIKALKSMFARFGLPETITSDNGRQFVSQEMKTICLENNIKLFHVTPYWPQANGEVERQNRSILKRLRIAQAKNLDWKDELQKFLIMHRVTPHSTTGISPGELMFNRKLRGKLPFVEDEEEEGRNICYEEIRDRDNYKKEAGKEYSDEKRKAKKSRVTEGDLVLVKQQKKDKLTTPYNKVPYKVISKSGNSVLVKSPEGNEFTRNSMHLKKYYSDEAEDSDNNETPDLGELAGQGLEEHEIIDEEVIEDPEEPPVEVVRRSGRTRQAPQRYGDFKLY